MKKSSKPRPPSELETLRARLEEAEQTLEATAAVALVESPVTKAHGLFYMDPTAVSQTITTLGNGGIKAETSLFTNEILQEIYQGKATV